MGSTCCVNKTQIKIIKTIKDKNSKDNIRDYDKNYSPSVYRLDLCLYITRKRVNIGQVCQLAVSTS